MNPTLAYAYSRVRGLIATRSRAVRRHALADVQAGRPAPGRMGSGQQILLRHSAGSTGNFPYYTAQTVVAALLAVTFGILAYVHAADVEPGPWTMPLAGGLTVVSGLCLYQAIARRFGPAVIDEDRYARARSALDASGDSCARPMSVLLTAVMTVMFLVDGAFSGYTLTTTAFASLFTPRVAMFASFAWSCAIAWLLYHLTSAAAREGAVNARRALVRNLLESSRPADHARADAMIERVGNALNNDFTQAANRYRARVTLALVVLGLSFATLVVRVSTETTDSSLDQPEATQVE